MDELSQVSGSNAKNEPSRRQLMLWKFDTDAVWYLDTSISIPFEPSLVCVQIQFCFESTRPYLVALSAAGSPTRPNHYTLPWGHSKQRNAIAILAKGKITVAKSN